MSQILTDKEKETLVAIAKDTLHAIVKKNKKLELDKCEYEITDKLKQPSGVFVTLKSNGSLRGCIGYVVGVEPLYVGVRDNAINAACEDPRFGPVSEKELASIEIEISVMTPLEKLSPDKVEVGRHGLVIKKGFRQGLLLPQVATEWGWDREEFLKHTCLKAGLPESAYLDKDIELFAFSAEVFGDGGR